MTTPAKHNLQAWGGFNKDLTSTKCSFYNLETSNKVIDNLSFASATAASASAATFLASSAPLLASTSSFATIFCVYSASLFSIDKCYINFSVSIDAF